MRNLHIDIIGRVLIVIYQHLGSKADTTFTLEELIAWCTGMDNIRVTTMLMGLAVKLGYLKKPAGQPRPIPGAQPFYAITPAGILAAKRAISEAKKQEKAQERINCEARFAKRIWDLLRIRQKLTAQGAAETLVDVGTPIKTTQTKVAAYLRAWSKAQPDAIQISKRLIDGQKRYVLVKDLGLTPPQIPSKPPKKTAGAAV